MSMPESKLFPILPDEMTPRVKNLRDILLKRARENRKDDWVDKSGLPDFSKPLPGKSELEPVIIRRARGIAAILEALTDPERAKRTNSYKIFPGELLVGILPMGSNGLGKIFPDYLDHEERHMASISNRSELSIVGHNVVNYQRLVKEGIGSILEHCDSEIKKIGPAPEGDDEDRLDFYRAVKISCEAIVKYAHRFADLAADMAKAEPEGQRRQELLDIERICRKVPMEPAATFQEALQSILFVQIGLRAGMDLMSLGRLDQTLQPFLARSGKPSAEDLAKAVELIECLIIKLAGPLNLTTDHLVDQDHIDYGITMGTHAWYADQRGNVNQFLQNVVIGGKNAAGADATVDCTHVILQAWSNVNLSTPGLYVRLHKESPQALLDHTALSIARTGSLPAIINDDVIIPGLIKTLMQDGTLKEKSTATALANDYCVDGCWEPILHGECDWTFNMINGMTLLECALNEGATLDSNPMTLRGGKRSYRTPRVNNYDDLKCALKANMDFFVFRSAVAMFNYYLLDEFIVPSPLYSAFLGTCLERGRDKSWGGTQYVIAGTVLSGLPNMVNSIAAIKKWVFEEKKYKMEDVLAAFRNNFKAPDSAPPEKQIIYSDIHADFFCHSPKFGNNDPATNEIARQIVDYFLESLEAGKDFADEVYRFASADPKKARRNQRLRMAAGYYGPPIEECLTKNEVTIAFTAGLGTFATYALMGMGTAASADRGANEPLAMNNTPTPGTVERGFGHTLASLKALDLSRFPAGAPVDLCLEIGNETAENKADLVRAVIDGFLKNNCNTLSLTLGNTEQYLKIYQLAVQASKNDEKANNELLKWGHVIVRAGGWQTPFITMSLVQQEHYTRAPVVP